jgi:alkylated DNA repair dioxygenase AlkB
MAALTETGDVRLVEGFAPDSEALYRRLVQAVGWDTSMRARHAASFGVPYNYSGVEWPEAPFPAGLMPLLARVSGYLGYEPNNCLAHHYPDGESKMGFHSDATEHLAPGTGITIVSLGAERTLTFRRIGDPATTEAYRLNSGSLLHMSAGMQSCWKHAILPDPEAAGGRISLTFRRMVGG